MTHDQRNKHLWEINPFLAKSERSLVFFSQKRMGKTNHPMSLEHGPIVGLMIVK